MRLKANVEPIPAYSPGKSRPGAIKLSSNENPLGPSPAAIEAITGAAAHVHVYPDALGRPLLDTLADRLGLDSDRLIIGNGSDELMALACAAYLNAGENTVSAEHTFSQYEFATRLYAGEYRPAPMNNLTFHIDAILEATDERTRIIWLCNPNNPTGTMIPEAQVRRVLELVGRDTLVVVDEAYSDYVDSPDFPDSRSLVDEFPNLLVLRTFSKVYGLAALRVGYGFGSSEVVSGLRRVKQPFNSNAIALAAADAALSDTGFRKQSLELNRTQRDRMSEFFRQHKLPYIESQANFVTVDPGIPAKRFFELMLSEGVAVRPLDSFALPNMARITVGTEEQVDRLFEAFSAVTTFGG
ncbi:MAG: histidinol-phosphate transaminase [Spirochaetota bacterium]